MTKLIIILSSCLLLAGCWDEVLYRDVAIVPLMGIDGGPGAIDGFYSFASIEEESITYATAEGKGISLRASRNNAFTHTNEMLDVSQLEVALISEKAAKHDVYNYLDVLFRAPRNRLSGRLIVAKGDMKEYFDKLGMLPMSPPEFYRGLLDTSIKFSLIPDLDLQKMGTYLFDAGIDVALPAVRIAKETGFPEVFGTALFKDKVFSGHYLDRKESAILQGLQKKKNKYLQFIYIWEKDGVKYPITVEYVKSKKKWDIKDGRIDLSYKFKFSVEEFPHNHLEYEKTQIEVNEFLSKELTKDFQKVIDKLQEAESDPIGFGQTVRAFHPEIWGKGKWHDTYVNMDIKIKVKAEIVRTGILN
ncbi:MAG TPA: Ger(x)C family spore germination protein [Sporosarcina psychrophila]|uniref:Ger(X)C family spore germination protein n=1 Tax=Sporosarcina psychrophila TaxID=1476 RepID=A0A921KEY5_SPOPS|nr:Ger(x)C family spore germination protein [Sporosarcina psychrophila]